MQRLLFYLVDWLILTQGNFPHCFLGWGGDEKEKQQCRVHPDQGQGPGIEAETPSMLRPTL